MKAIAVLVLLPLVLLSGCSSQGNLKQQIDNNLSCQTLPPSSPPDWIGNPQARQPGYYYGAGVASGIGVSFSQLQEQSRAQAQAELAALLETRITTSLTQDTEVSASQQGEQQKTTIRQIVHAHSDLLVSGIEVADTWFNHNTCQLWTRVRLDEQSVKHSRAQIKTATLQKLESLSRDVADIRHLIEQDPNVFLREYGLTIDADQYLRALTLDIPEDELFAILDIYRSYGNDPNSSAMKLGIWTSEPYASANTGLMMQGKYQPKSVTSLLHALASLPLDSNALQRLAHYARQRQIAETSSQVMDPISYQGWINKQLAYFSAEGDKIGQRHQQQVDQLRQQLHNDTISRNQFDQQLEILNNQQKKQWQQLSERQKSEFASSAAHSRNRDKFDDRLYAVHFAACFGNRNNLEILQQNGHSLSRKTALGHSPQWVAEHCNNTQTQQFLSGH
ncbi:LPP20 family lipoprotein [Bacterioplanoides pacificum]|uniref:LPP20 family lipoprotein n=1 Tax=Bacterioplanoides pacificum TaxID=1171596 RepID=A0ABV7VQH1_9GAMM